MNIAYIELTIPSELTPLNEWFDEHPTITIHTIQIVGLNVYIFYL